MLHSNVQYCCIGKGFCGSIWTLEGSQDDVCTAIKREDGGPGRSVTNDYNMHLRVLQSTLQHPPSMPLSIPQCHELIQPTDTWWQLHLHQFPAGYSACRALISERIPKVPRPISDKIVNLFCAGNASLTDFVKSNVDDDACLIRPYLGRRRHRQEASSTSRFQRFSLRNVPLHIDQMEALGLDAGSYAETMADALALMHWGAQIDANDVEFVLAPPRRGGPPPPSTFQSEYLGIHCMWILDFDCCRPLSMDEAGIEKACVAFFRNDPFYPRPGSREAADEELWQVFKQRFLVASRRILREVSEDGRFLSEKLVERIEEEGRLRRGRKDKLACVEHLSY
ncbi:zinc finger protein-domain-containing protein [Phaeosphaeriaceae sp. PMI808]|nr:zinc finger protein-domain-containing protein [Phaeosphaeriaceae sp. PMI808]